MSFVQALEVLNEEMRECRNCGLCDTRNQVVTASGPHNSPIVLIGEAPGADEDIMGEPFMGRCGQLLSAILTKSGIERKDLYITNVCKCRPVEKGKRKGFKNRAPTPDEVLACKGWLWGELKIVKPKLILTAGKVATFLIMRETGKYTKLNKYVNQVHKSPWDDSIEVAAIYHPSYLLQSSMELTNTTIEFLKELRKNKLCQIQP